MKTTFTIFLLSSFAAIAVLGIFAMNHGGENGHGGCLAAAASGGNCLAETGGFVSVAFHFNAFRNFSTAVLQNQLATALILVVLLTLAFVLRNQLLKRVPAVTFGYKLEKESFVSHFERELTAWLALHENSPALVSAA